MSTVLAQVGASSSSAVQLAFTDFPPASIERSQFAPGSLEDLERIISELLPAMFPIDLMTRKGPASRRMWETMAATPLYEALTIWVMAAWPNQALDRVDTMVRVAIAVAPLWREGDWTTLRMVAVMRKAAQRPAHRDVRQHLGQPIHLVPYEAAPPELADPSWPHTITSSSLGRALIAHLFEALGEHGYLVTPSVVVLLDRYADIAVDHLNCVHLKYDTEASPGGLSGLDVFRAGRSIKENNKSNRITGVFRELPSETRVALSHLLLGTNHNPEASLLWRHMSGASPLDVSAEIVAEWRGNLPALCPSILASTDRRRRRMRQRSRKGEDLRRAFERVVAADLCVADLGVGERAIAI
jgi:hypothetical protein